MAYLPLKSFLMASFLINMRFRDKHKVYESDYYCITFRWQSYLAFKYKNYFSHIDFSSLIKIFLSSFLAILHCRKRMNKDINMFFFVMVQWYKYYKLGTRAMLEKTYVNMDQWYKSIHEYWPIKSLRINS